LREPSRSRELPFWAVTPVYTPAARSNNINWKLRYFDTEGVEIGWVTADPYDYAITHPDGEKAWSFLLVPWSVYEEPVKASAHYEQTPEGLMMSDVQNYLDLNPKEHLEFIEEETTPRDEIGSTTLIETDD
jgi:hypothetical protein